MTVAGINIFLFIAWTLVAYIVTGSVLTVAFLFVVDVFHAIRMSQDEDSEAESEE